MRYRFLGRIHNETKFQAESKFRITGPARWAVPKICLDKETPLLPKSHFLDYRPTLTSFWPWRNRNIENLIYRVAISNSRALQICNQIFANFSRHPDIPRQRYTILAKIAFLEYWPTLTPFLTVNRSRYRPTDFPQPEQNEPETQAQSKFRITSPTPYAVHKIWANNPTPRFRKCCQIFAQFFV